MKNRMILVILVLITLAKVSSLNAATNSLYLGVSLGGNYDSNVNRANDNEVDEWESTISGFVSLAREFPAGALSLKYAPTFKYNHRTENNDFDHSLNLTGYRDLSGRLRFSLSDTFTKTDDLWGNYLSSTATGVPDTTETDATDNNSAQTYRPLSDRIGRQEFWENYFSTNLDFKYAKNSSVKLGYNNRILEYDESNSDNYIYHEPWLNLSYWLNPHWNASLSYRHTKAEFDISEDSKAHDVGFNLSYVHSVQDKVFGGVKYTEKNYDKPIGNIPADRNDYYSVRANLGWSHSFTPQKTLSLNAGPEYVKKDNAEKDENTTAFFDIKYRNGFQNGSWFIQAQGGIEDRSFDAIDEGLSEYQRINLGVNWLFTKDISGNLSGYFRTDNFLEDSSDGDEKEYGGTAALSYSLARWYYISGRYVYNQVNADINSGDYTDHRFYITLGFSKEMKRW